jgi:hypothetical protein
MALAFKRLRLTSSADFFHRNTVRVFRQALGRRDARA